MRQFHKAGAALLAGLAALGCGTAFAEGQGTTAPQHETQPPGGEPQGAQNPQGKQEGKQEGKQQEDKRNALGAGVGAQGGCGGQGFVLGPLDTGSMSTAQGYGAGLGSSGEVTEPGRPGASTPAPIPQYWLADASLFVANAANTAQTLANEQSLGVQAPSVLGNQAQFLLTSTDRALSSLGSLQTNAEATNPRAVADIRSAMDQLNAAKGQAQQVLDAANAGTFGPNQQPTIRSAYEHLQAAERQMATVGRTYGAQGFVLASACNFRGGRGLGVGIGGKGTPATPKAPEKGEPAEKGGQPAEKGGQPAEKGGQPAEKGGQPAEKGGQQGGQPGGQP